SGLSAVPGRVPARVRRPHDAGPAGPGIARRGERLARLPADGQSRARATRGAAGGGPARRGGPGRGRPIPGPGRGPAARRGGVHPAHARVALVPGGSLARTRRRARLGGGPGPSVACGSLGARLGGDVGGGGTGAAVVAAVRAGDALGLAGRWWPLAT